VAVVGGYLSRIVVGGMDVEKTEVEEEFDK
jgi:hypothetical protein